MKKILSALLTLALFLSVLSGCANSGTSGVNSENEPSATPEMADSEKAGEEIPGEYRGLSGKEFKWDTASFVLTEVTEDLGSEEAQLIKPEGKWVMAVFTITDGRIEVGRLEELLVNQGNIKLDDYAPATFSAQGISIDDNTAYAVGTIHAFFDVAADCDFNAADIAVNEEISDIVTAKAPEADVAILQLGNDEIEIRITDVHIDDAGKLVVPIEGLTSKYPWRDLLVEAILDGETIFLEISKASSNSFIRTSDRLFEKLPDQLVLYSRGNEQNAIVFDVSAGVFI